MQQMPELVGIHFTVEQWNTIAAVLNEAPAKVSRVILNEIERQFAEHERRKRPQEANVGPRLVGGEDMPVDAVG